MQITLTRMDNRQEIVDTNFGHKSSEKCVPLTPSAILSEIVRRIREQACKNVIN